jgi:uncharacterized protein (DUF433 family)
MSKDLDVDWSGCEEVEQVPGKVSGVPILRGTRVQADAIVEIYEVGLGAAEIAVTFDLDVAQVQAVIDYMLNQYHTRLIEEGLRQDERGELIAHEDVVKRFSRRDGT